MKTEECKYKFIINEDKENHCKSIENEKNEYEQIQNELKNEFEKQKNNIIKNKRNTIYFYDDQKDIDTNDKQLEEIEQNLSILRKWSGRNIYSIIFDSKVHGDGSNNVLGDKVINKSHLYFIHFDNRQNIYGGYVSEGINEYNTNINDSNAFVFSLKRNNQNTIKKYLIKQNQHHHAFVLCSNYKSLFYFGYGGEYCKDITTFKVGSLQSQCKPYSYEYNSENKPLSGNTLGGKVERIIVI